MKRMIRVFVVILFLLTVIPSWWEANLREAKADAADLKVSPAVQSDADLAALMVKSFEPVVYGNVTDPVGNMKRLDAYQPIIVPAGESNHISANALSAVIYIESGAQPDAVVRFGGKPSKYSCAGIAMFSPRTARGYGLHVADDWLRYYLSYANSPNARIRAIRWQKLIHADERFDPKKAIPAAARYLGDSAKVYGDTKMAIACYHAGGPNISTTRKIYRKGGGEEVKWDEMVLDIDPGSHPQCYRFLHDHLQDESVWYYFKVACAGNARKLWKSDRKAFVKKVAFYDKAGRAGRRPRLAQEMIWYSDQLPVWNEKEMHSLIAKGYLVHISAGKQNNIIVRPGVLHPAVAPSASKQLCYLAKMVKEYGGGPIQISGGFRTYSQHRHYVEAGMSPTMFTTHRLGQGTDLSVKVGKKTGDAQEWALAKGRAEGRWVFWYEGREEDINRHIHVSFNPNFVEPEASKTVVASTATQKARQPGFWSCAWKRVSHKQTMVAKAWWSFGLMIGWMIWRRPKRRPTKRRKRR